MPIPGPSPVVVTPAVIPAGSPFWLRVNGVWSQVEGIVPTTTIGTERPRSTFTSVDGNRYEQRSTLARRSWDWALPFAASPHLALARLAAEASAEVWLMTDEAAAGNMLATRDCVGNESAAAVDCGGVPMRTLLTGTVITARVRGGAPTTFSAWLSTVTAWPGAGVSFATIAYPGGSTTLISGAVAGQHQVTFTPSEDGVATIVGPPLWTRLIAGPMLTEDTAPLSWIPGESMPCPVVVDDPGDVLRMHHTGAWRHDYTLSVREIG